LGSTKSNNTLSEISSISARSSGDVYDDVPMTLSKVVDEVNKISEGVVTSVLSDEYLNQESDEGEDNDINDVETDGGWLLSYT